jgi:predicted transposase YbfD/YdcC
MADVEYTQLVDRLASVADPRKRRGQRYAWSVILTLIAAALVSGERHGRGIGQWVRERREALCQRLGLVRLPSEATLRRALQQIDPMQLTAAIADLAAVLPAEGPTSPVGLAVDGKEIRGTSHHGVPCFLVGLVRHDGRVLDQEAAPSKLREAVAVRALLARHPLRGAVVTADALLAERPLARQIRAAGGHYFAVSKDNQPLTVQAIAELFAKQPWLADERAAAYQRVVTHDKGHGRVETRTLEASPCLNAWLDWPDVGQVLKRTTRRLIVATGEVTEEVTYALTSLTREQADAATLERLWRGHWTIENQVHYVRDVSFGEDAGQAYRGHTAHALATLRNAILNLFRHAGWTRIPDALRHYAAHLDETLTLIGVPA